MSQSLNSLLFCFLGSPVSKSRGAGLFVTGGYASVLAAGDGCLCFGPMPRVTIVKWVSPFMRRDVHAGCWPFGKPLSLLSVFLWSPLTTFGGAPPCLVIGCVQYAGRERFLLSWSGDQWYSYYR